MISHQNLTSLDLKISGKPFVGFADIFIFAINWNLAKSNASPVDGTPPIESQNQDTNTKIYKLKKYENSKWPKLKFACQFCRKTGCPVPPHKNQALTCPVEINKTWGQIWLKIPLICTPFAFGPLVWLGFVGSVWPCYRISRSWRWQAAVCLRGHRLDKLNQRQIVEACLGNQIWN